MSTSFLVARLVNQPLLCDQATASAALAFLGDRGGVHSLVVDGEALELAQLQDQAQGQPRRRFREYQVRDGVAHVPVIGSLVARSSSLRPPSGLTGYSAVRQALETALADDDVQGIMLEIDSGGGEASGALELARYVREAAYLKPVWAMVNEAAASSAYAIASGAERIVAPRTAKLGSIGALALVMDRSRELAKRGRVAHVIRSAPRKARPTGLEAVTDADLAAVQASVQQLHEMFVELVAEHREISTEIINGTEARVLGAAEALEIGLADEIMSYGGAYLAFTESLTTGAVPVSFVPEENHMPTLNRGTAAAGALSADILAQARAQLAQRMSAITSLPEARGQMADLASYMALETDLSADQAKRVLELAGKATSYGVLAREMAGERNPDVGGDDVEDEVMGDDLDGLLAYCRKLEGRDRHDLGNVTRVRRSK